MELLVLSYHFVSPVYSMAFLLFQGLMVVVKEIFWFLLSEVPLNNCVLHFLLGPSIGPAHPARFRSVQPPLCNLECANFGLPFSSEI